MLPVERPNGGGGLPMKRRDPHANPAPLSGSFGKEEDQVRGKPTVNPGGPEQEPFECVCSPGSPTGMSSFGVGMFLQGAGTFLEFPPGKGPGIRDPALWEW